MQTSSLELNADRRMETDGAPMSEGDSSKTAKQVLSPTSMSRVVRGSFPDRQFDVDFWQYQGDTAIFEAAWELVEIAGAFKGRQVELKPDFKDFLRTLNEHQVRYLIVGGYAVMKYTEPFYTKDMDIWVDTAPDHATHTDQALVAFDAPMADLTIHDLTQQQVVFQFGVAPARVDVMTSIDGVTFGEAVGASGTDQLWCDPHLDSLLGASETEQENDQSGNGQDSPGTAGEVRQDAQLN